MTKRCKINGCYKDAVGYDVPTEGFKRKQYCAEHYERYKTKQREYAAVQQTLPDCGAKVSSECQGKVGPQRAKEGHTTCIHCGKILDEWNRKAEEENAKLRSLHACESLDEIKSWIETHLL